MIKFRLIIFIFCCMSAMGAFAQSSFSGFNYQAILVENGLPITNSSVEMKAEIRFTDSLGTLLYDETWIGQTSNRGYISHVVGRGTPGNNGVYPAFSSIAWTDSTYYLNVFMKDSASGLFEMVSTGQIYSVPFALYSKTTAQKFYLSTLSDVDTTGLVPGQVLKWDGFNWVAANDSINSSDTVSYAYTSIWSVYADTASYTYNALNIIPSDTASFAFYGDTASYAAAANYAVYAGNATYATTAGIANTANNTWLTTGNTGTLSQHFVGTTDATDLTIKTNNVTRMTIKSNGRVGIGTANPLTDFHAMGNNGFLWEGTFGTGTIPTQGAGTRFMWYPKKAAIRGGVLDAAQGSYWDDIRIGNYSFGFGRNVRAEGLHSFSFGEMTSALAEYSAAIGWGSTIFTAGKYGFAAGHSNQITNEGGFALGRGNVVSGYYGGALGYHSEANGNYSRSFGFYSRANGQHSTAMGYYATASHNGSFIFVDYATPSSGYVVFTTAANQFMVRASGGYVFYSNAAMTSGVSLAPGSGSWSSLSDSTQKENFRTVDYNEILEKVKAINIYTWNYKSQDKSIRHIGPTAQEFARLFNLGENNSTISTVDIDGVNMAAIKALMKRNEELELKVKDLNAALGELEKLKKERAEFIELLNALEKKVAEGSRPGLVKAGEK
jgi:hypothetical protein